MDFGEFVRIFFKRRGQDIFLSSVVEKVARLLMVIWITHVVPKDEVGLVVYAQTSLIFIIPFIGLGINQGFIRYGALSDSQSEKKNLFVIILRKGLSYSSIMMMIVIALSPWITKNMPEARLYLILLSFQFISLFLMESIKIYVRLLNLNRLYARINIVYSVVLLLAAMVFSLFKGALGYAVALSFTAFPLALYYIKRLKISVASPVSPLFDLKKFLQYGLVASLVNVLSQLLFAVDIILIGNVLPGSEELIAQYKVSNIIPFSMLILGLVFVRAEYVRLTYMSKKDRGYLFRYYRNYLKVFFMFGLSMLVFFYFFSGDLLRLFGKSYAGGGELMFIFAVGVVGGLLFRVPMGSMLTAIGWVKLNALNSFVVFLLNVGLSYWAILHWGIRGAAFVTSGLMWISGLFSLVAVWYFVKYGEKYPVE